MIQNKGLIILCYLVFGIALLKCNSGSQKPPNITQNQNKKEDILKVTKSITKDINSKRIELNIATLDSGNFFFNSREGTVYLLFERGFANFVFGLNRCEYKFPCELKGDIIKIKWKFDEFDCDFDVGFNRKYNLKSEPKVGDYFAEVSLGIDSVITVNYLFKEFIFKINEQGRLNKLPIDTLFPVKFDLANY